MQNDRLICVKIWGPKEGVCVWIGFPKPTPKGHPMCQNLGTQQMCACLGFRLNPNELKEDRQTDRLRCFFLFFPKHHESWPPLRLQAPSRSSERRGSAFGCPAGERNATKRGSAARERLARAGPRVFFFGGGTRWLVGGGPEARIVGLKNRGNSQLSIL